MDGLFINKATGPRQDMLTTVPQLITNCEGLEIMRQTILANAVMWVTPADNAETLEFFAY